MLEHVLALGLDPGDYLAENVSADLVANLWLLV